MNTDLSTKPLKMQLKLHNSDTTIDTLHTAPTPPFTRRAEIPKKVEKAIMVVKQNPLSKRRRKPGRLCKGIVMCFTQPMLNCVVLDKSLG